VEGAGEDERRHGRGGERDAEIARDASDLEASSDAGHLGRRRAKVREDQEAGG